MIRNVQLFSRLREQLIDIRKDGNETNKFQLKKIMRLSDGIEKQVSWFSSCGAHLASSDGSTIFVRPRFHLGSPQTTADINNLEADLQVAVSQVFQKE